LNKNFEFKNSLLLPKTNTKYLSFFNFDTSKLSNGVYYYTINANGIDGSAFTSTKKMALMK